MIRELLKIFKLTKTKLDSELIITCFVNNFLLAYLAFLVSPGWWGLCDSLEWTDDGPSPSIPFVDLPFANTPISCCEGQLLTLIHV